LDTYWEDSLHDAAAAGIRIAYLFLTHPAEQVAPPPSARPDHERYVDLQNHVAEALAACVELHTAAATPSGVAAGVKAALAALTLREVDSSRVELRT
jgi:hypothetical protein